MNCLELWTGAICTYSSEADLRPLAYPLTQIISGVARLVPTARYIPLRLRCVRMLNRIAASTGTFIPVSMLLLDMLEMKELDRPPTGGVGKAIDLRAELKVCLTFSFLMLIYVVFVLMLGKNPLKYAFSIYWLLRVFLSGEQVYPEDTSISGGMCVFRRRGTCWTSSSMELFCCFLWVVFHSSCTIEEFLQDYQSWKVPETNEGAYSLGMYYA